MVSDAAPCPILTLTLTPIMKASWDKADDELERAKLADARLQEAAGKKHKAKVNSRAATLPLIPSLTA